jgi:hypothetical protein
VTSEMGQGGRKAQIEHIWSPLPGNRPCWSHLEDVAHIKSRYSNTIADARPLWLASVVRAKILLSMHARNRGRNL